MNVDQGSPKGHVKLVKLSLSVAYETLLMKKRSFVVKISLFFMCREVFHAKYCCTNKYCVLKDNYCQSSIYTR